MLGGGSPYDPYAYPVNPTKTSKGKIMKSLVLLNDSKITYAKLIFSNHCSQKIISNIELVWKKSYLQEIIWPDFTAVLWMDLANAQAV